MQNNTAILFGGKSCEHDASIGSFENVYSNLRAENSDAVDLIFYLDRARKVFVNRVDFQIENPFAYTQSNTVLSITEWMDYVKKNDVFIFPILHGQNGEDGHIQGFAAFLELKGSFDTALACSMSMSKYHLARYVSTFNGVHIPKTARVTDIDETNRCLLDFQNQDIVIKPNSLGASFLTEKYFLEKSNIHAIKEHCGNILEYDTSALVQQYIEGIEFSCGCLWYDNKIKVMPLAMIDTQSKFFSRHEKRTNGTSKTRIVPPAEETNYMKQIKRISKAVFRDLDFQQRARFDFIYNETEDKIYFLEINPIPGLLKDAMFIKMLRAEQISMNDFIVNAKKNYTRIPQKQFNTHDNLV